jgi:UDP-galactopyranose mutase
LISQKYKKYIDNNFNKKLIYGGRLADYAYYDMDMTISASLKKFDFIKKNF